MPSGNFEVIPVSDIVVGARMRELKDTSPSAVDHQERSLESLATSLATHGIFHPIIVGKDLELLAGERRLLASKILSSKGVPIRGVPVHHIRVQFSDAVADEDRKAIELEENLRRFDMQWLEKVRGIREYHNLQLAINPAWSQASTAEALNISASSVSKALSLASYIDVNPELAQATGPASAGRRMVAQQQRVIEQNLSSRLSFDAVTGGLVMDAPAATAVPLSSEKYEILEADFHNWAAHYNGQPFDLVHCDFPYGINIDRSATLSTGAHITNKYSDTAEVFTSLLSTLQANLPRLFAPSAHLFFWFPMSRYVMVRERLSEIGFSVNPVPLIWHKTCNSGIVSDMDRNQKNVYEAAFLCSIGDRKVLSTIANVYGAPTANSTHMSAKPVPMLKHFFASLVDTGTRVLDPTCGGGSSIRAAFALKSAYALGLELDPVIVSRAKTDLKLDIGKAKAASV